MTDIHSCSYECVRPDCVRRAREHLHEAQRLLRDWQDWAEWFTGKRSMLNKNLQSIMERTHEALEQTP